jgi:hypothetical protein
MKKLIVAAATMLLACTTSFAQFNVNLGYANSTESYKTGSDKFSSRLNGFTVGVGYSLELADDFYFTPGLNYLFVAAPDIDIMRAGWASLKGNVTEHYINVPMVLSYDFSFSGGSKFFLFAGPTACIGIASNIKLTAAVPGYKVDDTINNYGANDYRRFDILLGGGIGLKFSDTYLFKVGYDFGMLDRSGLQGESVRRRQLSVGIAYLFD